MYFYILWLFHISSRLHFLLTLFSLLCSRSPMVPVCGNHALAWLAVCVPHHIGSIYALLLHFLNPFSLLWFCGSVERERLIHSFTLKSFLGVGGHKIPKTKNSSITLPFWPPPSPPPPPPTSCCGHSVMQSHVHRHMRQRGGGGAGGHCAPIHKFCQCI